MTIRFLLAFIIKSGSMTLGFILSVLMVKALGASENGIFIYSLTLINISALFISGGIGKFLIQKLGSIQKNTDIFQFEIIKQSFIHILLNYLIFLIILYLFCDYFINKIPVNVTDNYFLIALLIIVALTSLIDRETGILKGLNQPIWAEFCIQIVPVTIMIILVLFFYYELGIDTAIILFVNAKIVTLIFLYVKRKTVSISDKKVIIKININKQKLFYQNNLPFLLIAFNNTFATQTSVFFVGLFSDSSDVTYINIAEKLSSLTALSMIVFNMIIHPKIVQLSAQGRKNDLMKLKRNIALITFTYACLAGAVITTWYYEILTVTYGSEFARNTFYCTILFIIAHAINSAFGPVAPILTMSGYARNTLTGQLLGVGVNIILNIILVPMYGIYGAAVSFLISTLVWNIILTYVLHQKLLVKA